MWQAGFGQPDQRLRYDRPTLHHAAFDRAVGPGLHDVRWPRLSTHPGAGTGLAYALNVDDDADALQA